MTMSPATGPSVLDHAVLSLSRQDPASSVAPAIGARLAETLLGHRHHNALGDARLEALRRYAVLYRTSGAALAEGASYSTSLTADETKWVRDVVDGWGTTAVAERSLPRWIAAASILALVCLIGSL